MKRQSKNKQMGKLKMFWMVIPPHRPGCHSFCSKMLPLGINCWFVASVFLIAEQCYVDETVCCTWWIWTLSPISFHGCLLNLSTHEAFINSACSSIWGNFLLRALYPFEDDCMDLPRSVMSFTCQYLSSVFSVVLDTEDTVQTEQDLAQHGRGSLMHL